MLRKEGRKKRKAGRGQKILENSIQVYESRIAIAEKQFLPPSPNPVPQSVSRGTKLLQKSATNAANNPRRIPILRNKVLQNVPNWQKEVFPKAFGGTLTEKEYVPANQIQPHHWKSIVGAAVSA